MTNNGKFTNSCPKGKNKFKPVNRLSKMFDLYHTHKGKRAEWNGTTGKIVGYSTEHLIMMVNKECGKVGKSYNGVMMEDQHSYLDMRHNANGYLFVDENDLVMTQDINYV